MKKNANTIEQKEYEYSLVYASLSFPPDNIDINKSYSVRIMGNQCLLLENGKVISEDEHYIKYYFKPIDKSWEELIKLIG